MSNMRYTSKTEAEDDVTNVPLMTSIIIQLNTSINLSYAYDSKFHR